MSLKIILLIQNSNTVYIYLKKKIYIYIFIRWKNIFVERSKNLTKYRSENISVIDYQNNYGYYIEVNVLNVNDNAAKSFNILTTNLNNLIILIQTKLFLNMYFSKTVLSVYFIIIKCIKKEKLI